MPPSPHDPSRRDFLRLVGGAAALAAATGCARARLDQIVPYVRQPESLVPGRPELYATTLPRGEDALGVLVETHEGRPTKVSGNPDHPASLGATDPQCEAALVDLFDADRARTPERAGHPATWAELDAALAALSAAARAAGGRGLRLLTGAVGSPTLARQIAALLAALPGARWHVHEPLGRDAERAGARLAFGRDVRTLLEPGAAAVIVSLGADFLGPVPGGLRHARAFADRRRARAVDPDGMCRLYAVETTPTLTGAAADHRLALRGADLEAFALALAGALESPGAPASPGAFAGPGGEADRWRRVLARELAQHRGASLVVAGAEQPPAVHAAAHALNRALGNVGRTVRYADAAAPGLPEPRSLPALVEDMAAGRVTALVVLDGNPVYDAPADLAFARALARVPLSLRLGLLADETSARCTWHVPAAHALEAWSDARTFDGTASLVQPVIDPLHGGRSAHQLLARLVGGPAGTGYEAVRATWQAASAGSLERDWAAWLSAGLIPRTAWPLVDVDAAPVAAWAKGVAPAAGAPEGFELLFRADPSVGDGRGANNPWLQELPRPLSGLSWDNAALVAPSTAARLGVRDGDVVELRAGDAAVRAPVLALPGQAENAVTLTLGGGRARGGRHGTGVGVDAYPLRTTWAPWTRADLALALTGERHALVGIQGHDAMEGRDLARVTTLASFLAGTAEAARVHRREPRPDLFPPRNPPGHAWGMSIDLSACIGCNACVVACQAENNVPAVGRAETARGRAMHWLRVDRYRTARPAGPRTVFQPRPCMHCEDAPCELVCPVGATVHGPEGLNEMVYNRCIGTRYCSNNCPYKVRRFNFFDYARRGIPLVPAMANPDVTVRDRGVMEKCTYCVQRINAGRIRAEEENRPLQDGEIRTACQEACPTQAIVFGDVHDPASEVSRRKADPLDYALLDELNTRPRTTYLARLVHADPALGGEA